MKVVSQGKPEGDPTRRKYGPLAQVSPKASQPEENKIKYLF